MERVAIIYGVTEGVKHGQRFRAELRRQGFIYTDDVESAEFIVAHSAGGMFTVDYPQSRFILMINPPYWPEKSTGRRIGERFAIDIRHGLRPGFVSFWFRKNIWNVSYGLFSPKRNKSIARRYQNFHLPKAVQKHDDIVVVRNHHDAWLKPDLEVLNRVHPTLEVRHFSGEHDDCWRNPEPYVALLKERSNSTQHQTKATKMKDTL